MSWPSGPGCPPFAPAGLRSELVGLADVLVVDALDLDEAALAHELDRAVATVQGLGEPVLDEVEGDPALPRGHTLDVVEHGRLDDLEELAGLGRCDAVALPAALERPVDTGPQVAGQVVVHR